MHNYNFTKCRKLYFVFGFAFGTVFPIVAFSIRAYEFNTEKALSLIASDPLLWIICLAPLILGAVAYFAGIKQDEVKLKINQCKITENELKEANAKINNTINELELNNSELLASKKSEEELKQLETAINHFSKIIEKIGQFDLSIQIEAGHNSESESNNLAEVLSIALVNLQSMVNDLIETVYATKEAKENITKTSCLISNGVDKQKNEIGQISIKIEDLSNYISINNENAHLVAQITNEAYSKLNELNKITTLTSNGMENVRQAVDEGNNIILELYQSSEKIGGIVNLITDIANQTKLLALNASIEAARAGDAGRGFAVVADEVGKLSEKTQQAVSEISDSIQGIRSYTNQAVSKMEKGSEEVANGKKSMDEVHDGLGSLSNEMLDMVKNTEELADTNQKQFEISNTIKNNIKKIESVTESNVSNVLEINGAVINLDKTVENVNKMIHQFKIKAE